MIRALTASAALLVALGVILSVDRPLTAQGPGSDIGEARQALDAAREQQRSARARGERLERQAAQARGAADKALQQSAALAARVQQAEAGIVAAEAKLDLVTRERRDLDRRLADRRAPLVRLTAALQTMSRRPLALSALQPGSLRDLVYTRAALDSAVPLVRKRTSALRDDLARTRTLQEEARLAVADRRQAESELRGRRAQLVALAEEERLKARRASGGADRESRRALVLAEQTLDLDQLVGRLEQAGALRARLAALPGPVLRPANPEQASVSSRPSAARPGATAAPARYQLPVAGEIVAGFGEAGRSGARQYGLVLAAGKAAQVVAPGAGRITFAGPYRGYGSIVIVEHAGGWTSLVTGLASLDLSIGQRVAAGYPLGLAGVNDTPIALELRKNGEPVNPLDHLR